MKLHLNALMVVGRLACMLVSIKVNNVIFYIYIYLSFKRLKDALHQGKKGGMKRGMFGRWSF